MFEIRRAERQDVAAIHSMIRGLADYEKLSHLCVATAADIEDALFASQPAAEVLIACKHGELSP